MSSSYLVAALVAASSLVASVNGHMTLKQPAPYGASSLDTSPLLADGTNFPCKQRDGVYAAASSTNSYAIGAEVPLSFSGTASHGGGSCQISLSTDKAPTKNSKWMVIHSIQGGCPVKDSAGNTGSDSYTFKVPEGVTPGDYTLAWTWFNRIGNREMYMNCAPFTVTSGSSKTKRGLEARKAFPLQSKRDTSASFPAMYVANICSQKCIAAPEPNNLAFPDPGANVDNFGGSQQPATATCICDASGNSAPVSAAAGSGSPGATLAAAPAAASAASVASAATSAVASVASVASAAATAATSAASASVSAPASAATSVVASSGSADSGVLSTAVATVTAVTTAAAAATGAATATASAASSASTGSSTATTGNTTTCSGGATVICSADGSQFGLCNNGSALMQAVASGTKCSSGNIVAA